MRGFSKKIAFVLPLVIGLIGCGSPPKVATYIEPLSQVKLSNEKTYLEVLSNISTQMNVPILEYSGEFGEIKYIEYNAKYFRITDIYRNFHQELSKSCSGYLSGRVNSLETIKASKKVDFSQYIAQEKLDLIHSVHQKDSPGGVSGFNFDGGSVGWKAIYRPSSEASTNELSEISLINDYVDFALKGHVYYKKVTSKESYVCLGDNAVSEILIIGNIEGQSKNIVLLVSKDAAFKMIQKQLELTLEAVVYKLNATTFEEAVIAIEISRKKAEDEKMRKAEETKLQAQRDKLKHKKELELMIKPAGIGRKICRDGKLTFQAHRNLVIDPYNGGPIQNYKNDGQISGFIEGVSPDKTRLQIRISGFAFKTSGINPVSTPMLENIPAQAGSITWDSKERWFFCE